MRSVAVSIAILFIGVNPDLSAASELLDIGSTGREAGERMAHECLSGDRLFECFKEKGFRCAAVGEPLRRSYSCYVSLKDGCFRTRFQLEENGWNSSDRWLTGKCVDSHEPVLEPGVRWRYDNTNAPDELVFALLVNHVFAETLHRSDNLDVQNKEPHHAGYHFVEAGLTGKMGSADVVRYFAERYLGIEKEVEDLSKKLLCDGDRPRYDGAENFFVFNQLDDVRLHVYERHLFLARSDLQASGLFDLDKAIREFPGAFSSVAMEHEAARDGSVAAILEHASHLCSEPWRRSFSVSGPSTDD